MRLLFSILAVAALGACSVPPYIHQADEYNRASSEFGRPVTDISGVTVCYNSRSATPAQVRKLAADECARFGKKVVFSEQNYTTCPLAAPVAAVFACKGDEETEGGFGNDVQAVPGGVLRVYDGIKFRY